MTVSQKFVAWPAVAAALLFVGHCSTAHAQTTVNPTRAVFTASADHGVTLSDGTEKLSNYELRTVTMIETTVIVWSFDLGKPVPDASDEIDVTLPSLAGNLMSDTLYQARVASVGPGGESESDLSNPFALLGPPAAATGLALVP